LPQLSDEALTEATRLVRRRGGSQADLLERALQRRDASVTEVSDRASGGVLNATVLDATVVGTDDTSAGELPVDQSPGQSGELAVGTQFAGYVIEGVAGQGGMGVVYRARQLRPSRIVA